MCQASTVNTDACISRTTPQNRRTDIATADPGAVCTKGAEHSYPASMGATGGKMVWVKPMEGGKSRNEGIRYKES